MNDRELLEMAAKAAGIVVHAPGQKLRDDIGYGHVGLWTEETTCWNPLTNDGDALRLAVRLRIDVAHTNIHSPQVHALADAKVQVWEEISADPYAATRRAIVRAAAEIGRSIASASEAAPNGEKP